MGGSFIFGRFKIAKNHENNSNIQNKNLKKNSAHLTVFGSVFSDETAKYRLGMLGLWFMASIRTIRGSAVVFGARPELEQSGRRRATTTSSVLLSILIHSNLR